MKIWQWNGYGFHAMNTCVYTWLYSFAPNSTDILLDIQNTFDSMERRLSRFDPHSELSQLNNFDGEDFSASPILFSVMQAALWAAIATGGLYDFTLHTQLAHAGYDRSFEKLVSHSVSFPDIAASVTPNYSQLLLHPFNRSISRPPGLKIDLGGIAKGWTVDRTADRLVSLGAFLVNAGGDLYAHGTPPNRTAWEVTIPHPTGMHPAESTLYVANRAVATSSTIHRRWMRGNTVQHHIIDPRTGHPAATDILTATVIAKRVAVAEVYSKVAIILGGKDGLAYLENLPHIEGLLVTKDFEILKTSGMTDYLHQPEVYVA